MHRIGDSDTPIKRNDKGEIIINSKTNVSAEESRSLSLSERGATSVDRRLKDALKQTIEKKKPTEETKQRLRKSLMNNARIQDDNGKWYTANPKKKEDLERMIAQGKAHVPNSPDRVENKERGALGYDKSNLRFFPNKRIPISKTGYNLLYVQHEMSAGQIITMMPLINIPVKTSILLGMMHNTYLPKYDDSLSLLKQYMIIVRLGLADEWGESMRMMAATHLFVLQSQNLLTFKELKEYCDHCTIRDDPKGELVNHILQLHKQGKLDRQALINLTEKVQSVSFYKSAWNDPKASYTEDIMKDLEDDKRDTCGNLTDTMIRLTELYKTGEISPEDYCNRMTDVHYDATYGILRAYEVAIMRMMGENYLPKEFFSSLICEKLTPKFSNLDPVLVEKITSDRAVLMHGRKILMKKTGIVTTTESETGTVSQEQGPLPVLDLGPQPVPVLTDWLDLVEFLDYGGQGKESLVEDLKRLTVYDKSIRQAQITEKANQEENRDPMDEEEEEREEEEEEEILFSEEGRVEEVPPTPKRTEEEEANVSSMGVD